MHTSTIDEAQTQLTKLIVLAEQGEEVVIEREGKPVARLIAVRQENGVRRGGQWRGQVRIAPDFDDLPNDIGEAFGLPKK
jgi:antitoxin (DNA-binding transcriptional repressor) of toxin-antitoxin stability system